jgi:drug/metabolite transporter (DMT)-like permease
MRTFLLTVATLAAFAANSLLCRMTLGDNLADPLSFTVIRLVSGALILVPIARRSGGAPWRWAGAGSWPSGVALFIYAIAFSFAYVSLGAGMGALILFGAVQVTMIGTGLASGERPGPAQWTGLVVALVGLAYLVSPGLTAPDLPGAAAMSAAGVAWGVYSLRGRGVAAPASATAGNFVRASLLAAPIGLAALSSWDLHARGAGLAVTSGAVTSGLGYVIWYRALRGLTATTAAIVQLLVPVIAALGGALLLSETISARLVVASGLILSGVALATAVRTSR